MVLKNKADLNRSSDRIGSTIIAHHNFVFFWLMVFGNENYKKNKYVSGNHSAAVRWKDWGCKAML
jgi:hypothetical protein